LARPPLLRRVQKGRKEGRRRGDCLSTITKGRAERDKKESLGTSGVPPEKKKKNKTWTGR